MEQTQMAPNLEWFSFTEAHKRCMLSSSRTSSAPTAFLFFTWSTGLGELHEKFSTYYKTGVLDDFVWL